MTPHKLELPDEKAQIDWKDSAAEKRRKACIKHKRKKQKENRNG